MIRAGLVAALLVWLSLPAAAKTVPLADGLRRCAGETDQVQRLACFDALVAALPKIEADQFGLTADIARKRDPVGERQAKDAVLPGKILALHQGSRGEWIFTLDNQQVWDQSEVEPNKRFEVGEAVHIEPGAMGSWWLAADKGRKTRVKRVN